MKPADAHTLGRALDQLDGRLRQLPAAGLRGTELFVLAAVDALGVGAFPTAIGDRLQMRRPNVSATLKDLERRGFVCADTDSAVPDRRRRPFRLTERGCEVLHARQGIRDQWLATQASERLTAAEAEALRVALPLLARLAGE